MTGLYINRKSKFDAQQKIYHSSSKCILFKFDICRCLSCKDIASQRWTNRQICYIFRNYVWIQIASYNLRLSNDACDYIK